jgi:uncharacterized protein (TIGR02147 family)
MNIFEFADYRLYVQERVKKLPKRGRGEFLKIAKALGMHTSSVSQVFKGQKRLTLEQGSRLAEHLGLNDLESDYLLNLIEKERAGTKDLEARIEKRLQKIRELASQLVNRLPRDQVLSEESKALFYSNWFYSAIRLGTDIEGLQTIEALSEYFSLQPALVNEVLQFLLACGLCIEQDGLYKMGPKRTHLEATSPLISRHHMNWRMKAVERSTKLEHSEELQLSSPVVLSKKDALYVKSLLMTQVQDVLKTATPSPSETLYCLNVDWFKVK